MEQTKPEHDGASHLIHGVRQTDDPMRVARLWAVLALCLASYGCLCLRSCAAGAITPNSSNMIALQGPRSALLYQMHGGGSTLFTTLILLPRGASPGWNGSSLSIDCVKGSETIHWNRPAGRAELRLDYDGGAHAVEALGQSWPVASDSAFMITFDDDWQPTMRSVQLRPASFQRSALARIQDALADDKDVASLRPIG